MGKKKKYIVDVFDGEFKEYDFNDETYNVEDIVYFSEKTGLLGLFNKITDYILLLIKSGDFTPSDNIIT